MVEESGKKVETWKNAYKWHFISPSSVWWVFETPSDFWLVQASPSDVPLPEVSSWFSIHCLDRLSLQNKFVLLEIGCTEAVV